MSGFAPIAELTISQAAKAMQHGRDWVYERMAKWKSSGGAYGLPFVVDEETSRRFILWKDIEDYQARRKRLARDVG